MLACACPAWLNAGANCERLPIYAGFNTKLSSAGLVYKHYGREIIAKMIGKPQSDPDVETIYLAVYKNFVEAVDAVDNGESSMSSGSPALLASM